MVVELLEDKKKWDQFVENSPQGLLFHKWNFLKTVERHSKTKLLPYCVYLGERLRCIFPFFVGRDHGLLAMYSPPPRTHIPYLGPAFDPSMQARRASAREKILDQATRELCMEIDKIAPRFVSIATVPNLLDVRSLIWENYRERLKLTYVIDLEKSLDEIWGSFSRNCRRQIRDMSAHSPEIQQTTDIIPLFDLWKVRYSELGLQLSRLSESCLKELVAAFPHDVTIYNVIIDGKLAAASACCVMQKERYHWWIGGVNLRKDLGVNDYFLWEIVKLAKSQGFKKLDLGAGDDRLARYKSKFDPVLEPYFTLEKTDTLFEMGRSIKRVLRWRAKKESTSENRRRRC